MNASIAAPAMPALQVWSQIPVHAIPSAQAKAVTSHLKSDCPRSGVFCALSALLCRLGRVCHFVQFAASGDAPLRMQFEDVVKSAQDAAVLVRVY